MVCFFLSFQATAVADPNRNGTSTATPTPSPQNPLEFNPAATSTTPVHPSGRHLSSSNSFDAKSHLPAGFSLGYQMPVEATRLINTLQQSPLPLPNTVANASTTDMIRSDTYRYLAHSHGDQPQQPPGGMIGKEKSNFGDLARNLHSYSYLQGGGDGDHASLLPRHNQITQQYSSSTDEGCDTDHGGEWNFVYLGGIRI